jgi:hypothetical protein
VPVACLIVLATACGSDFRPKEIAPTGEPAAPLGQVLDLEVSLPNLVIGTSPMRGADLEMRLDIEAGGEARRDARYAFGRARLAMGSSEVEDLSDGHTTVTISDSVWATGRIGPLRIENTVFEMLLDGVPADGGWSVSGSSRESQTTLHGTFRGWRRHRFLVATTDFFSGGRIVEVALVKESEIRVGDALESISTDPILRRTADAVFVVNRLSFDNLQRLDPDRGFRTAWQTGVGVGANPHDVVLLSDDKAYASRFEPPFNDVAVVNPRSGAVLSSIVLEELAENRDRTPRADRAVIVEGSVFVGLQDIDRTFTRFGEGKLAVIDTERDEIAGAIPLGGKNPGEIRVVRGEDGRAKLWVALGGILPGLQQQELSGGVVIVDAVNRVVERTVLDDDVAGGNVAGLAVASPQLGYVIVSDSEFRNRVLAFDPQRSDVLRTVWESTDFIPEIEIDGRGVLAVPDRSFLDPRLCLYRVPAGPTSPEVPIGCARLALPAVSFEPLD